MTKTDKKISLPDTSLLVITWIGPSFYEMREAQAFIDSLDLSSGKELAKRFAPIWAHYDQAMQNRKFAILQLFKLIVERSGNQLQLVCLGAGIDPLSLEISAKYNISRAFDVDRDAGLVECKARLISQLDGSVPVRTVAADVSNKKELYRALQHFGWNPDKRTVVIVEGLSYYLARDTLWDSLELFRSPNNSNHLIIEYYKTDQNIAAEFRDPSKKGFAEIYEDVDLLTRYDRAAIEECLSTWSGEVVEFYTLKRAEYERYGKNKIYQDENSGWQEVALCKI